MSKRDKQADELKAAIAGLEAQRSLLGDTVVEPALAALRQQLSQLEPSPVDAASDEERKIVTVLFVDVSGFTALSEKLDPEEVRGLINTCFEYLVPVVQKYEGTILSSMRSAPSNSICGRVGSLTRSCGRVSSWKSG